MAKKKPDNATAGSVLRGTTRFIQYDLAGREKAYYQVDAFEPDAGVRGEKKAIGHHIIIFDCSGSMTYALPELKAMVGKLLTVDEVLNEDLLVSLLSYSGSGDCQLHLSRVRVGEVMKPSSPHARAISGLRTRGLTCISQALSKAVELTNPEELTAVTLHSDGYANDPSVFSELSALRSACARLRERSKNVFVNTIAYGSAADFRLLAEVANLVSGSVVRADRAKDVYDSLTETASKVSAEAAPVLEEPLGPYEMQVFFSASVRRVLGAQGPLVVTGLTASDDRRVYKYRRHASKTSWARVESPVTQHGPEVFAFARASLALGLQNQAKYALVSTGDETLRHHQKALTTEAVAAMATDLEAVLFTPKVLEAHRILGAPARVTKSSLLDVLQVLSDARDDYLVYLPTLQAEYKRRGVRQIPGIRKEDGSLEAPWLRTEPLDDGQWVKVSSYDTSRDTATVNMLISRPVALYDPQAGARVEKVAGIDVSRLSTFNNYTIVGDGALTIPGLIVRITSPVLLAKLRELGVMVASYPTAFTAQDAYSLRLDDLPLVSYESSPEPPSEATMKSLAVAKTLVSFLSAHLAEDGGLYTQEQVAELRRHYLSKNLYLAFPMTNHYTNLEEALAAGEVDYRTSYKVDFGFGEISSLSKLYSANKLLSRFFERDEPKKSEDKKKGEKTEKEDALSFPLDPGSGIREKKLSARTKIGPVDEFQRPLLDEWLSGNLTEELGELLRLVGAEGLIEVLADPKSDAEERTTAMADAKRKLDAFIDKTYREEICPLAFYVGSTGVLPDELPAKALSAEELQKAYPNLVLSKDEKEGLFFQFGEVLLTVYAKRTLYTVSRDQAGATA